MKPVIRFSSPPLHQGLLIICIFLLAALCLLLPRPTFADELSDTRKLVSAGKYPEALVATDSFLAQHPNDAHMLFLKGLILTEQNQTEKAIVVFTKLTQEYPALPEPYNNLAVLFAASGQYDKARAALEMAIRTNPSYATAYENLGDLYAKLASQSYDKALQMNSGNGSAKAKLAMVHSLVGGTTAAQGAKVAAAPVIAVTKQASAPASVPPAPVVTVASATSAKPEAKPAVTAKPEPKPVAKPVAGNNADRDDIAQALNEWAAAWSSKDVKKYLSYYANDFQTPKGMSRKAWADERQSRIVGKSRINVKVESPQITFSGNTATVKFRQAYTSDRLSASSKKAMVFTKSGGKWKIQQEHAG